MTLLQLRLERFQSCNVEIDLVSHTSDGGPEVGRLRVRVFCDLEKVKLGMSVEEEIGGLEVAISLVGHGLCTSQVMRQGSRIDEPPVEQDWFRGSLG